jgi:aspartate carbamoyltransferase catalytic subunit
MSEWGVTVARDLDAVIGDVDICYLLRVQRERQSDQHFPSAREYSELWGLDARRVRFMKPDALIMHPGPMNRGVEISADVSESPRALIVEQVANGVAVRMGLLYLMLGGENAEVSR